MLVLAICLIVGLVILFVATFIIYKRMPAPKGCEKLRISDENCNACNNENCTIRKDNE